jgi:hypothetical protein
MSPTEHAGMLAARQHILCRLQAEAKNREPDSLAWIERERFVVAVAANEWADAHGINRSITTADVERIEVRAVGHVDYASKLALYLAEALYVTDALGGDT